MRVLVYQRSTSQSNEVQRRQNAGQRIRTQYRAIQQRIAVHTVNIITSQYIAIQHSIPQYNVIESSTGQFNNAEQERIGVTTQCDSTTQHRSAATAIATVQCKNAVKVRTSTTHFNNAVQKYSARAQYNNTTQQRTSTTHCNTATQNALRQNTQCNSS